MAIVTEITQHRARQPSMRVPLASFLTADQFELERQRIFSQSWLLVGHESDVSKPGDFFTRELEAPKASVMVVRGADGVVRAFHNICRHRGNVLTRERAGCARRFSCAFHGWTWKNDGSLLGVTDEGQFGDLDKSALGLLPVRCETWNGQIFLSFTSEPRESLAEWLEDLHAGFDDYFERQVKLSSHRFELEANWNLAVNSFTEGYHTLYIHKNTAGDYQGGKSNPQRHRPFMQLMKRHSRYSAPANPDHKLVLAEQIAYRYGHKLLPAACFDNASLPPAVNPSRAEHWLFDVVELFPNVVILFGQHYRIELTFQPVSHCRTIVVNETFVDKPRNLAERAGQELFATRERDVVREDLSLLEGQHAALATQAMPHVHLSRQETAIAHHFEVRREMMAGEL